MACHIVTIDHMTGLGVVRQNGPLFLEPKKGTPLARLVTAHIPAHCYSLGAVHAGSEVMTGH